MGDTGNVRRHGSVLFCFGPIKYFILLPFQKPRILKANDLNRTPEEKENAQEGKDGRVPLT